MTFEDTILQIMKTHKIRHNDKREKLLKILRDNQLGLDQYQITAEMRKQFPNITLTTIHNNLRTFEIAGLLEKNVRYGDTKYALAEGRITRYSERQVILKNGYAG